MKELNNKFLNILGIFFLFFLAMIWLQMKAMSKFMKKKF